MFLKMFHNPGAGPLEKVHFVVLFLGGKKKTTCGKIESMEKGTFWLLCSLLSSIVVALQQSDLTLKIDS